MDREQKEIPIGELMAKYKEAQNRLPAVLDTVKRKVIIGGTQFEIEGATLNPYTDYWQPADTCECNPVKIGEGNYRGIFEYQKNPQSYVAVVSGYEVQPNGGIKVKFYGATLNTHQLLGGSMYQAGVSLEEIVQSHNLGLPIKLNSSGPEMAYVRIKFDINKEGSYHPNCESSYHIYVPTPISLTQENSLELFNKIKNLATAIDYVALQLIIKALNPKSKTIESRITLTGGCFGDKQGNFQRGLMKL